MKVVSKSKETLFSDLFIGDVFEYDGAYYMKIDNECKVMGVGLESGDVCRFDSKITVTKVNGYFVIE